MKYFRAFVFIGALAVLALALGFIFRVPLALGLWPWEDGRYSYLFVGSILAAVSAAMLWVGWSGQLGVLPAGSLNVFVIAVSTTAYFFLLHLQGRSDMLAFALAGSAIALVSGGTFLRTHPLPLVDPRPTPRLVRVSFGIFIAGLIPTGTMLILRKPVFPWELNPDSSVVFGCIFLGDAFYFLYGLLRPRWDNAVGQLLSFLAYDLVLIVPFVMLFGTVEPGRMLNLTLYTLVLVYSGGLAIYYLFVNAETRFGAL